MTFTSRNVGAARFGIALIVLVLYGAAVAVLVNVQIPDGNKDLLNFLLGGLSTLIGAIGGYYFNVANKRESNGS